MLFFYGTGTTRLLTEPLPTVVCAHCGTPNSLSCSVFSRYASLFWIPVFPFGKTSLTVCQHCKQTLTAKEMPAAYQAPVQELQRQARVPLTNFAWLLMLAAGVLLLIGAGLFGSRHPVAETKFTPNAAHASAMVSTPAASKPTT